MSRRFGLVLGGGGVLGGAWTVGALVALAEVQALDPRDAELIVGTSAGSVTAALLGAGVSVDELVAHQLGRSARSGPLARIGWDYETATGGSRPPLPSAHFGSPALVAGAARWRHLPPTAVLSGLLPEGRGTLGTVGKLVEDVQREVGAPADGWSPHAGVRCVALDYDTGRRVAFGDPMAPAAPLPCAVMASCAIPGWYSPVVIHETRYIDGGAASSTNIDLAAGHGLDEVFVLAPTVSFSLDNPSGIRGRLERAWRERVSRRALREVGKLHQAGTEVTVLGPGAEDLEAIGANLMDVSRRTLVLETALRTAAAELRNPEPLEALIDRVGTDTIDDADAGNGSTATGA